jgi:hypothetical protein
LGPGPSPYIHDGVDPVYEEPTVPFGLRPAHLGDEGRRTVDGALQQWNDGFAPRTHPGPADEQSAVVADLPDDGWDLGQHVSDAVRMAREGGWEEVEEEGCTHLIAAGKRIPALPTESSIEISSRRSTETVSASSTEISSRRSVETVSSLSLMNAADIMRK